ncbi:MAG TPA: hypothetical protein VFY06_00180 [Verrucomicrobiae bacterium]|nr:hypothetical protein [Verrucomicrobiae bacterium]
MWTIVLIAAKPLSQNGRTFRTSKMPRNFIMNQTNEMMSEWASAGLLIWAGIGVAVVILVALLFLRLRSKKQPPVQGPPTQ